MDELKILIVEDNLSTMQELEKQIKKIGCKPVKVVNNARAALQYIKHEYVDAVISKVIINGEPEGIQLANKLKHIKLPVIFIASSEDPTIYQLAKQANPTGYLVQPIKGVELRSAIDSSLKKINNKKKVKMKEGFIHDALFVKQNNLLRKIPLADVLWIKTEGNYSLIHTTSKKYILKLSLKKVLEQLPPDYFIQIQRAYIIALPKIEDIDISTNEVIINKERLPLGRNFRDALFSCLKILK